MIVSEDIAAALREIAVKDGLVPETWRGMAREYYPIAGFYRQAARLEHELGSTESLPVEKVVQSFMYWVYVTWAALVDGNTNELRRGLLSLKVELGVMEHVLFHEKWDMKWAWTKGPWLLCLTALLADWRDEAWKSNLENLRGHIDRRINGDGQKLAILEAEHLRREGQIVQARKMVETIIADETSPEIIILARLVVARIYRDSGWNQTANDTYALIVATADTPRVLVAVAAREKDGMATVAKSTNGCE
ncbi:MAG: hypothetical protein Q7S66_02985 [bacterium]|nr:hypothetical protein [bacterium]